MTYLVGIAHDAARAVLLGIQCASCDEPFMKAHQEPVHCSTCYRMQEVPLYPRAIYEEQTREFFKREARKKKASKWAKMAIQTTRNEE